MSEYVLSIDGNTEAYRRPFAVDVAIESDVGHKPDSRPRQHDMKRARRVDSDTMFIRLVAEPERSARRA